MKVIILFVAFLLGHLTLFFILSFVGLLWWDTYKEIIRHVGWFIIYTIFIGVWAGFLVARSYYLANQRYFDKIW